MRSQSVGSRSRNLPKAAIPALLIKISIVPNSAIAFSTAVFTELISATSAVIAIAFTVGHVLYSYIIDFGLSSGNWDEINSFFR
jgi:hypothetical protein